MRRLYKLTEAIPIDPSSKFSFKVDGLTYSMIRLQAGHSRGRVFINYNFCSMWNPLFWMFHFHEFFHLIFYLTKFKTGHKIIDWFNKLYAMPINIKKIRISARKW